MQPENPLAWWLERLELMQPDRIELGLARITEVATAAGLLKPDYRIVTVAGTNGKGSTVAYCASILMHSGLSVGVYTSPHFIDFNERIVINDVRVTDADLCEAFTHIDRCRGQIELTYFEFTTLAAIYCFKKHAIDVAVLEVGLGGRLDATNAWDSDVACITSIGIDHTDWLGDDRESIGREKAGVARAGCALVCGETDPLSSVRNYANQIGARLLQTGEDFGCEQQDAERWVYRGPHGTMELPNPAIAASWAKANAAVAICACGQLLGSMPLVDALAGAMRDVTIPGRMQQLQYRSTTVLLDVAHNGAAARLLSQHLEKNPLQGQTIAVFSCMQDKDAEAIIAELCPQVDQWFIGQIDYPRAFDSPELANILASTTGAGTQVFASVIKAFEAAVAQSGVGSRVVVFGSFHMVGPVLNYLSKQ